MLVLEKEPAFCFTCSHAFNFHMLHLNFCTGCSVSNRIRPSVSNFLLQWRRIYYIQVSRWDFACSVLHFTCLLLLNWNFLCSCIRGRLIEVNENILANPSILQEKVSFKLVINLLYPLSTSDLTSDLFLFFSSLPQKDTLLLYYQSLKKAKA